MFLRFCLMGSLLLSTISVGLAEEWDCYKDDDMDCSEVTSTITESCADAGSCSVGGQFQICISGSQETRVVDNTVKVLLEGTPGIDKESFTNGTTEIVCAEHRNCASACDPPTGTGDWTCKEDESASWSTQDSYFNSYASGATCPDEE